MRTHPTSSPFEGQFVVNIIKVIACNLRSQNLRFPGVYIVWNGDHALYVGSSANVCRRVRRTKNHQKGRSKAFARRTHIDIYPCDSLRQARHLEAELIGIYKPPYNEQGQWQSSRSIQQLKAEHSKLLLPSLKSQASNQDSVLEVSL